MKYSIISLCPGTGVGEYGSAKYFQTALAIDIDKKFLASFDANHPGIPTLDDDISTPETIAKAKKKVPLIDGIISSTPCPDFTNCKSGPKAVKASSKESYLYIDAVEWVRAYQPMFYIAENVEPVRRSWQFGAATAMLEKLGYVWRIWVLDAADYGVPQHRVRSFLVAVKQGLNVPQCPKPTHGDSHQCKKNKKLKSYTMLKDCIYDLFERELEAIKKDEVAHEKFLTEEMLGIGKLSAERAWYLADIPPGGNWKDLPEYKQRLLLNKLNEKGKKPFEGLAARFAWLSTPGTLRTSPSIIKCSMPVHPGIDSLIRQRWNEPNRTLMARPDNIKLAIHPGTGNHAMTSKACSLKPSLFSGYRVDFAKSSNIITRYLTVREYARIMGLPDSFVPIGSVADKYRMIGNGIPPKLMESVCRAVFEALPNSNKSDQSNADAAA